MRVKPIRLIGTAALLAILITGCRGESSVQEQQPTGQRPLFDPPVVITTAKALRDFGALSGSDTTENNPITRWAKDRLGIIQKNKWIVTEQNEALTTRIKLALSEGEELPDVLFLTNHDIPELLESLVDSGKIMDIEQAFETYAPPRVKEAYEKNPEVWRTVMVHGKAWGLPQISDGVVGDPILWVRQDWLDKLNLKPPATIEELEQVLDAFTYGDPDGNGKADTRGLALAGKNTLNGWMGDASFLFGAYGDQPYQWNRTKDGTLSYGSVQPQVKPALIKLNDWYEKGYIDPDFGTHDEDKAASLVTSGVAGIISGPGWMGGWPLVETAAANPGAVMKPIPYPSGPEGKIGRVGSKMSYGSYFFRAGFTRMDAVFAYWDAVYGAFIEDPESDFRYGFGEGYDYIMKDGKPVFDFPGSNHSISSYLLFGPGSTPPHVIQGESLESRVYRGHVETPYEQRLAATSSKLYLEGRIVGAKQTEHSQRDQFVGPHTRTMALKWPLLKKLEKETYLKIVYGKAKADALDEFAEQWFALGGADITREVNEWDRQSP
ncbi:putative aldouronate transport system substrate-binding protein [Paenibacillus sp. UNCCL117]|uniref:extracellular solute-binding protein n=1 Tax=unclassified Paenibacillus TaxID=185978 RepID=UPI0008801C73|nr:MULTISPECIES: extracellular solute-binding protein [unclassified Paenibacillus]SDC41028.1 aldotetraouronic acid ABC transporter substrate-binding protein /aldotetraouronic acid ABC transporter substrate-binding protein [Paenibacillus sp. cl123]SFW13635.1 putative aldouronate transport system substrate-binding protein [Paenibacillus sp. UNCCL117]